MLPSSYDGQDCSLARALEIVGERWTLLVLRDAFYGVRRFNDFLAHLDMPRTVLSNRLRSLVECGVMVKVPDPGHSGRWLYELTDEGMEFVAQQRSEDPSITPEQMAAAVQRRFRVQVHPRSIQRRLRAEK